MRISYHISVRQKTEDRSRETMKWYSLGAVKLIRIKYVPVVSPTRSFKSPLAATRWAAEQCSRTPFPVTTYRVIQQESAENANFRTIIRLG